MDSSDDKLVDNGNLDFNELPVPQGETWFNAQVQRDRFLGGGGTTPEAATRTDKLALPQSRVEKLQPMGMLEKANSLLTRPEARTNKEGKWYMRTPDVPEWYQKQRVSLSKTYLGLDDKESNTSFLICNGAEPGETSRYTQITWAELPDQKGDNVKRTGYVKFTYDKEGKVTAITGHNGDKSIYDGWETTLFNDAAWYTGEIGASANPYIDEPGHPYNHLLAEQELTDIMTTITPKLERAATTGINKAFTEQTLATVKANDAMGEAAADFAEAYLSGDPAQIAAAREKLLPAVEAYDIATGRDPEEERKKNVKLS